MFKIALNAGHGKNTAGKRCIPTLDKNQTREWVLNNRICCKIEQKLKEYTGYELIRLDDTTGKTDVALKTRTDKANSFRADFYLSIHHNAGINGKSGGGVVAYVYPNVDSVTTDWQTALYNSVVRKTGLKGNRAIPLARKNLHELRESNMPAVLLECGFMDSSTDVPIILTDDFADKVASACVEVLARKGPLIKKTVQNEVKKPEIKSNSYFPKYQGATVSIVMALKSVGAESSYAYRRKIAAANNISDYSGTAEQNLYMLSLLKKGTLIKP